MKQFNLFRKMNANTCIALILFSLFISTNLSAQISKSQKFKEQYELKEVVVLSRHNIRAPLSGGNSILARATDHKWTDWTANPSELTSRGGALEVMMGQYFRKSLEAEGFFPEGYCPNSDEINIYANSMQRTIATAEYFKAGFLPTCNMGIYHRFAPSKMDPVFFPRLTKVSDDFVKQATKEIDEMFGKKGLAGVNESMKKSFETVSKVMNIKNSPACKNENVCGFTEPTKLIFKLGEEPNLSGSLKLATQIADALILQYFEVPNDKEAAFGNVLTNDEWESISKIKDVYGDILFAAPTVARNVANPLLRYIKDELESKHRKFTFLCGHDSNIGSITSALGFEEYSLANTIEKKTPIGSKLVFEKWEDRSTKKMYICVKMVYQSTEQLRNLMLLDVNTPPMSQEMKISGLKANEVGLYEFNDIIERFGSAISDYEKIK